MSRIDLHTHTNASDGTLPPQELVAEAVRAGLAAIAVTDHDTTGGLERALAAGSKHGLEVIPGIELSVDYPHGHMHVLGLWLPRTPHRLVKVLDRLKANRHDRNKRIVTKLNRIGVDISYQEVTALAGGDAVGRPHLARVLMDKGVVSSVDQAFAEYLGSRGKAYVPKEKLAPRDGIELLRNEGATVLLAHPYALTLDQAGLEQELLRFKAWGLDGLEAYYSEHTKEQTALFLTLAKELDLLVSGGSDFHGSVKPDIALGSGKGNLHVPYELLEKMKAHRLADNLPVD